MRSVEYNLISIDPPNDRNRNGRGLCTVAVTVALRPAIDLHIFFSFFLINLYLTL